MSERTAIEALEALDRDKWAVRTTVMQIMGIIRDYVPRACQRELEDKLFDAFFINGVELTTNQMRKEYEQWKKLELNVLMLQPRPPVQP
jgi:hypothetical protein